MKLRNCILSLTILMISVQSFAQIKDKVIEVSIIHKLVLPKTEMRTVDIGFISERYFSFDQKSGQLIELPNDFSDVVFEDKYVSRPIPLKKYFDHPCVLSVRYYDTDLAEDALGYEVIKFPEVSIGESLRFTTSVYYFEGLNGTPTPVDAYYSLYFGINEKQSEEIVEYKNFKLTGSDSELFRIRCTGNDMSPKNYTEILQQGLGSKYFKVN